MKTSFLIIFFCLPCTLLSAQTKSSPADSTKIKMASENKTVAEPLYVLDGTVQDFSLDLKAKENFFKALNPTDIEAIQILKDQSATEAYGEKGKNGVVLITTRNPKKKEG